MQDLSYLATNGVLTFDPNAYLGTPVAGTTVPNGKRFLTNTKLKAQPTSDNFVSRNKSTIKKVAAGGILIGLAACGLNCCKDGTGKIAEGISKLTKNTGKFVSETFSKVTKGLKPTPDSFLGKIGDAIKDLPNKAKNIFKK